MTQAAGPEEDKNGRSVSFGTLLKSLGQPLSAEASGATQGVSSRVEFVVNGLVEKHFDSSTSNLLFWDCLQFEVPFQMILVALSRGAEVNSEFLLNVLSAAAQLHVLCRCAAEKVGEDRWILRQRCLKHFDHMPWKLDP